MAKQLTFGNRVFIMTFFQQYLNLFILKNVSQFDRDPIAIRSVRDPLPSEKKLYSRFSQKFIVQYMIAIMHM